MKEVLYILAQSLYEDPISRVFTQVILSLFFLGALPSLIFLSSFIHKKYPILAKAPKNPILFVVSCTVGAGVGFFLSMLSWVFSLLFFSLFFVAMSPRFKSWTFLSIHPSLLTTIGILGTFVGIYMGLHNFNISNIDRSIPDLLRGLKIAFTTSIVGIVGAIFLKMIQSHIPEEGANKDVFNIFDNILQVLQNHFEQSKIHHQQILEKTEKNIETQNRMIQYLYSKISSLEKSVNKQSSDSFSKPLNEIKKAQ